MVDVCIVGGGLAGSLAAWRLRLEQPRRTLRLVEAGATLGGNHTWSFHATDLPDHSRGWIAPLVVARWPRHRVAFPGFVRTLDGEYCSATSDRLHHVISAALGDDVVLGATAEAVTRTRVEFSNGTHLEAHLVIDARGAHSVPVPVGWQTFLGQDVECEAPHGVDVPMLMDARVPQTGAFKFVYVLPFSPTRLLIEDTAYADGHEVDIEAARAAIRVYAARQGWAIARVLREEVGRLPIPLGGSLASFWTSDVPRVGLRAGLFHPTTGYSFPDAVATAELIASLDPLTPDRVYSGVQAFGERTWRERSFFRLLNRWLFRAASPAERSTILSQFYTRPEPLIARFYGARLTWRDRLRLVSGRPPVPVWRALAHLRD